MAKPKPGFRDSEFPSPGVKRVNYTNIVKISNDFCAQDAFASLAYAHPFRQAHTGDPEDGNAVGHNGNPAPVFPRNLLVDENRLEFPGTLHAQGLNAVSRQHAADD